MWPGLARHQNINTKTTKTDTQVKEQGAEGELDLPWKHPCRGNLHSTSKPITLEAESSDTIDNVKTKIGNACMIACRSSWRLITYGSTWDQKTKTPGKILAWDDCEAPNKPCRGR